MYESDEHWSQTNTASQTNTGTISKATLGKFLRDASEVSPTLLLKRFQCSSDWRWPWHNSEAVQFSLRWYLCARKSPYAPHPELNWTASELCNSVTRQLSAIHRDWAGSLHCYVLHVLGELMCALKIQWLGFRLLVLAVWGTVSVLSSQHLWRLPR